VLQFSGSLFYKALLEFAIRFLAMADHPNTTAKLEVYLTHLKCGRCEYGVEHLPYFMYPDF
jgi:hypothetical protein